MSDPRRQRPIKIEWTAPDRAAHLYIDLKLWSEVEWSEKRQAWCIQDAEGRCLTHAASVHAQTESKAEALARAEAMIRDGRLPNPEDAKRARDERVARDRERRSQQPSEIARKRLREEEDQWFRAKYKALDEEEDADQDQPFYEVIADVFDLADPDLWKSNSFARLRDRLILSLNKDISNLEHENRYLLRRYGKKRFEQIERYDNKGPKKAARLARARELLALLHPEAGPEAAK
jgi:hypothetical protein